MSRSKDLLREADERAIRSAIGFAVNWFVGRDARSKLWHREDHPTLDEARAAVLTHGKDEHGRQGLIYAITTDTRTVFVE